MTKGDVVFQKMVCNLDSVFSVWYAELSGDARRQHIEIALEVLDRSLRNFLYAKMHGSINEVTTTMESKIV